MPQRDPNSEETFDFVVNKGNGIKGLVDSGIETVPELYTVPIDERLEPNKIITHGSIPVIDVSNWDDPKVKESICEAAAEWGFFQIINHGVPLEVLDAVRESAHRFFGLPNEERSKYWPENSPTDTVVLTTSFAPRAETVFEWKDALTMRFGPHQYRDSVPLWPPVCRDEVLEYGESTKPVVRKLMEILLKGLKVKEIDKAREYALMTASVVTINYYPRCPNPDLAAGIFPHSDASVITVLLQDDNGGLYVRATDGNGWIHVKPIDGAFVVNIGDMLQIMSNDKYKSIEHRVVANGSKNRVSVPVFVTPRMDAVIGPLPEAMGSGEQPFYKKVVCADYFRHHFGKKHDGKKSLEFARI
ncbi:hypothetical protein V6N13_000650 [Hibiscus sabdariffa]|uniref:Fe2OG dioxygenase domain-containing protein n=1 Tax=Hibiscus sabdariffa TaxID=183260 RepID=A0ABR2G6Z6_9ROSI